MTRANTEQIKHTPWFAKAGAACSIVPISRFVGPDIFALKGGGYGCVFSLTGLDEEALTDLELEARVRQVEGALRGLPEGSCLYQYTRVMSGFDLPRQKQYRNEVTETFASDRLAHLDKTAAFRRIDLHWCLTLEPSQAKAFQRKPDENVADTSRMLSDLEKTATLLEGHLGSSLGLKLLGKAEALPQRTHADYALRCRARFPQRGAREAWSWALQNRQSDFCRSGKLWDNNLRQQGFAEAFERQQQATLP